MQRVVQSFLIASFLLLGGCATTNGVDSSQRVQISEADGRYRVHVPASRLVMTLPGRGWSMKPNNVGGGTASPRYFYFENPAEKLILSGWIEPDRMYTGARQLWKEESEKQKKAGMPPTTNVAYEKMAGWDSVMYDYVFGKHTSSHLRGHWVQSGTWIDVHLSTTTNDSSAENRARLKALLRAISVSTKPDA